MRLRLSVRTSRAGERSLLAVLQEHKFVTRHVLAGQGGEIQARAFDAAEAMPPRLKCASGNSEHHRKFKVSRVAGSGPCVSAIYPTFGITQVTQHFLELNE